MAYYVTCPYCGSNNDPSEKCECQIVDDCNFCSNAKTELCSKCSVIGNGSENHFVNYLIPEEKR